MTPVVETLLERVERGNVLLFIGDRVICHEGGWIALDQLTAQLTTRYGIPDDKVLSFSEVAQAYEDQEGHHVLMQSLHDRLEALGDEPQPRFISRK